MVWTDGVVDLIILVVLFVHMVWTDGVVDIVDHIIILVVLFVHMVWTDGVVDLLVGFVVRDNDNIILGFDWSW